MTRRPLIAAGACLIAVAVFLAVVRHAGRETPLEDVGDPAIAYYTGAKTGAFAGIDRWATYGMRADQLAATLAKAGYQCQLPRERAGIQPMRCTRQMAWPARTLAIEASIDYGQRGRLVAASARSDIAGAWSQSIGAAMRSLGWIEPQTLQVHGFSFGSADLLAYFAADAISAGGWREHCLSGPAMTDCPGLAQARSREGFPELPEQALRVGDVVEVSHLLEKVRLMPVHQRGPDNQPSDSLLVRVDGRRLWLDFASRDLAGREAKVSVALDSVGGAPVELMVAVDGEKRALPLAGRPRTDNAGAKKFLLPEQAQSAPAFAHWLTMPMQGAPQSYANLGPVLSRTDPAFFASTVEAILGKALQESRPEDILGLYPVLSTIEKRAAILRAGNFGSWMPPGMGEAMIRQAWPEQPALRAAWALGLCVQGAERDCLRRLALADPEAATLLRTEVTILAGEYEGLAADNPIRVHLKRMGELL